MNFPLCSSSAHRTANNWSSKFHFAIIKLTTISQHSNQTIMNFQKQLKPLSCGGTFMNTRKDGSLAASNQRAFQPRCHIGFLVCQKSLQDAAARSSNQHACTRQKLMGLNWYGTPHASNHTLDLKLKSEFMCWI